ncbi:MAG: hypothetical protein JJ975_06015 [Bacteroidia bacterium]|nr:hypothetical protein [Bacteroidia bacterium]
MAGYIGNLLLSTFTAISGGDNARAATLNHANLHTPAFNQTEIVVENTSPAVPEDTKEMFNSNVADTTGGDTTKHSTSSPTKRTHAAVIEVGGSGDAETYSFKNNTLAFYIRGGIDSKADADRYALGVQKFVDRFIDEHPEYADSLSNYAIYYHIDMAPGGTGFITKSLGDEITGINAVGGMWDTYNTFKADFERKVQIHLENLRNSDLKPNEPMGMR